MIYLALVFGFLSLWLAVIGLPLLLVGSASMSSVISTLLFSGVGLLIGMSAARTADGPTSKSLVRKAGIALCLGSVLCLAGVVLVSSVGSGRGPRAKSKLVRKPSIQVMVPEDGATGVGITDEFEVFISDGTLADQENFQLTLQKLAPGTDRPSQSWMLTARVEKVTDGGHRVLLVPEQPLEFNARYQAHLATTVEVDGRERSVFSEWRFTTQRRFLWIKGVDPLGFSLAINEDDSCDMVVASDALHHATPARRAVVYALSGGENRELASCDLEPGQRKSVTLGPDGGRLSKRYLWVVATDDEDREVAQFPLTGFADHDGRGVFVFPGSKGTHETPDGVTIHYGRTTWQTFSGKSVPLIEPTVLLRVQELRHGRCLTSVPRGYDVAGCYDVSAEWRLTPKKEIRPLGDRFWIEYSVPGTMRRKIALMPRFSLSMPAPGDSRIGAPVVAVAESGGGAYVPRLRLTGVGEVVDELGKKRVRLFPGGGEASLKTGSSEVLIGEMFEGDAMVGRRTVLVASGEPETAIAVGSGWSRVSMRRVDGRSFSTRATLDPCAIFSPELPFTYHPPEFGKVRKGDGFVLPMLVGKMSLLVKRDPATGWLLNWNEVYVAKPSGWVADVGSLDDLLEPSEVDRSRFDKQLRAWIGSRGHN